MTIRVLVADDSMVRAAFRVLLAGEEDIEVVAEASNGLEAVDKATRYQQGVILMDIRMPELDGLQATRRIVAADGEARILILATFDLDEYVYEALRAGASGFVLTDDSPEQLIDAIRTVARGDALLSPTITKRVIHAWTRSRSPSFWRMCVTCVLTVVHFQLATAAGASRFSLPREHPSLIREHD